MPKRSSITGLPTDTNALAKSIVDAATGDSVAVNPPIKNQAAVELGRLGGIKGGPARAAKLSPKKRKAIAQKAARARWAKDSPHNGKS